MTFHKLRLSLIFLTFGLGILLHLKLGFGDAWYLYLACLLFAVTHFLFGTVYAAFNFLKKGQMNQAELLLNQIKRPDWLLKTHRAYYYFGKGLIALQQKELAEGDDHLKKAIELGLRTAKDKALAHLNLAHIAYRKEEFSIAKAYLEKAKSFSTDDLMVKDNLERLEKALSRKK